MTVLLSRVKTYVCDKCNHLHGLEKYLCPAVCPVLSPGLNEGEDAHWCRQLVFISLKWPLKFIIKKQKNPKPLKGLWNCLIFLHIYHNKTVPFMKRTDSL